MHRFRWVAAMSAATLATGLAASSASAQTRWFADAQGEVKASIDLHKVQVVNGSAVVPGIKVVLVQRTLLAGDGGDVWYDTDASNPGPEYRASWVANSDILGLSKVDSFAGRGTAVRCDGLRIRAAQDDAGDFSRVYVPRSCLGKPDDVRVSVRTSRHTSSGLVVDWGPKARAFYPAVARG